jgi:hypothetical protein
MIVPLGRPPPIVQRMRGGPLVLVAVLLGGWSAARVWAWEHPLALAALAAGRDVAAATAAAPPRAAPHRARSSRAAPSIAALHGASGEAGFAGAQDIPTRASVLRAQRSYRTARNGPLSGVMLNLPPLSAAAPRLADRGAPPSSPAPEPARPFPPVLPGALAARAAGPGRWSLDGWAFWRQGSAAAPISQGRVPVYGASQAGAVLQYRLAPASRHDPRLYTRAYRALVPLGESELALGGSLRPLPRLPLRIAGEVRYTDAAFFNAFRPAAYAVTELAPMRLPLGTTLEAYGQAGWVGGPGETPFADAQAMLVRPVPIVGRLTGERLGLSLGAGAWGGAQRDAQRLDLGPTLRFDTRIGKVPARVSIDWRQRVAGEAAPGSGVAATLSTGF